MTTSIVLSSLLAVTFSRKCWKSLVCPRLCLHCLFFFYSFPVQACVKEATQMLPHLLPFDIYSLICICLYLQFSFVFDLCLTQMLPNLFPFDIYSATGSLVFVFLFEFVFVFYFCLYLCGVLCLYLCFICVCICV